MDTHPHSLTGTVGGKSACTESEQLGDPEHCHNTYTYSAERFWHYTVLGTLMSDIPRLQLLYLTAHLLGLLTVILDLLRIFGDQLIFGVQSLGDVILDQGKGGSRLSGKTLDHQERWQEILSVDVYSVSVASVTVRTCQYFYDLLWVIFVLGCKIRQGFHPQIGFFVTCKGQWFSDALVPIFFTRLQNVVILIIFHIVFDNFMKS